MTTEQLVLPIKRLDPTVRLPTYAYAGDAGLDLRSNEELVLKPLERRLIGTGLAIAIPEGFAGFVQPRSGWHTRWGCPWPTRPAWSMPTIVANSRSAPLT